MKPSRMLLFLLIGMILSALLFSFFIDINQNEYQNAFQKPLPQVTHEIKVSAALNGKESSFTFNSFHIGNGYILTCSHALRFPSHIKISSQLGYITIPVEYHDYKYTMNGNQVKVIGTEYDVALLYNKKLIGGPFVSFGDSNKLKIGTELILISNSYMKGTNIKTGILSMFSVDNIIATYSEETKKHEFITTIPVNPGDSGGPIFAIDIYTKNFEFIGMIYAILKGGDNYSFAFKSNYIKECIRKIKRKNL